MLFSSKLIPQVISPVNNKLHSHHPRNIWLLEWTEKFFFIFEWIMISYFCPHPRVGLQMEKEHSFMLNTNERRGCENAWAFRQTEKNIYRWFHWWKSDERRDIRRRHAVGIHNVAWATQHTHTTHKVKRYGKQVIGMWTVKKTEDHRSGGRISLRGHWTKWFFTDDERKFQNTRKWYRNLLCRIHSGMNESHSRLVIYCGWMEYIATGAATTTSKYQVSE